MMTATRTHHLIDRLPPVRGRLTADAPLAGVTWFRVGGTAEALVSRQVQKEQPPKPKPEKEPEADAEEKEDA